MTKPNPQHPARILMLAWSTVRLDAIRAAVRAAVAELVEPPREDTLVCPSTGEERFASDPIGAALETCCQELREECGMPTTAGTISKHSDDPKWLESYAGALDRYRDVAGAALIRSFGTST